MFGIFPSLVACYDMPASFPSTDQSLFITGAPLNDPVIKAAFNNVTAAITDKSLLNIKPSTYSEQTPNLPTYNDDPAKTCYWPKTQCTKSSNAALREDIRTCPGANQWGVSFDDGPSQNIISGSNVDDTTALLRALDQRKIKVTFFTVGARAYLYPDIVRAQYNAGHQIAIHTWSHKPLTSLTNEQIVAELKYNEAAIYRATKVVPRFVRPPYGDLDDRVRAIIQAMGYQIVYWTKDSEDSIQPDTSAASAAKVQSIISSWFVAQPGFISIQHDLWPFAVNIAIKGFDDFAAKGSPLNPMPIGTCLNQQFYSLNDNLSPPSSSTTSASQSTSATAITDRSSSTTAVSTSVTAITDRSSTTTTPTQPAPGPNQSIISGGESLSLDFWSLIVLMFIKF